MKTQSAKTPRARTLGRLLGSNSLRNKLLWLAATLFFAVPSVASQHFASLYDKSKQRDVWRLELAVPYLTNYSVFLLKHPRRLVIDLLDSKLTPHRCRVKVAPVKTCRVGRLDGKRARFVLDLNEEVQVLYSNLSRRQGKHFLDIGFVSINGAQKAQAEFVRRVEPMQTKAKPKGKFVVVIDPGHGGSKDVGSSNAGVDEKDLTLLFSNELRAILRKEKNIEVRVTRTKDNYMPLTKRLNLVRQRQADMLISIHADWNADPDVLGVAVYSQSNYAAEKYTQRFLENGNPKIINGQEWRGALPSAYDILFDITQRETLSHSIYLSRALLKEMRLYTPVLDQPHRFADFHLLSAPDVPSVLIEMGFLSNKQDLKNLKSKKWRRGLARSIAQGVKTYHLHAAKLQQGREQVKPAPAKKPKKNDKGKEKSYSIVERN